MQNNHRFFNNSNCKYFPCHPAADPSRFNCMFCYCPLYHLGVRCGGHFKYSGIKKIKDCMGCSLPHEPDFYDAVMEKLMDINA